MSRCLTLVLALLTLAVPSRADTPPPPFQPTGLAADFVQGLPGGREAYQLELLGRDFTRAMESFHEQWGSYPRSLAELEGHGLLPYRPLDVTGQVLPFVELGDAQLPPPGAVGVEVRPESIRLVVMGAEGDPLSPLVKVVDTPSPAPYVPLSKALDQTRALALAGRTAARLRAYYDCYGTFPADISTTLVTLGWESFNHRVVPSLDGRPGVTIGLEPGGGALRLDVNPDRLGAPRYEWVGAAPRPAWRMGGSGTQPYWLYAREVAGMGTATTPFGAVALIPPPGGATPPPAQPLPCRWNPWGVIHDSWGLRSDIETAARILTANPHPGPLPEAIGSTRAILELPVAPDGSALEWFTVDKALATADWQDEAARRALAALPPGLHLWFDGQQAGYVLQAAGVGMSTGRSHPAPGSGVPPDQVRREIDRLRTAAGAPLPEYLQTTLVTKLLQESTGPNDLRLAGTVEHFTELLDRYVLDNCGFPERWEEFQRGRRAVPLSFDPQTSRVSPGPGQTAFTIEIDTTGLFARMVVQPTIPETATYYFAVRPGPLGGIEAASLDALDVARHPQAMDLEYRVLMSTLVATD
ncbi:MAG TPA: hypothetical protein VEI97_13310 [bacterium]|nr:hypothetical protein [bacterium]